MVNALGIFQMQVITQLQFIIIIIIIIIIIVVIK